MDRTASWTPDGETINFNPTVLRSDEQLATINALSDTQQNQIYSKTKMLASYIGRMELTGYNIESVTRNIWLNLRGLFPSGLPTLKAVSGDLDRTASGVDSHLYTFFYLHISILFHDMVKRNPRHKCFRDECQMYCILPVFARRCLSDAKVHSLVYMIKNMLERNRRLLVSQGRTTESKSALNIFRHIVSLDEPALYDAYDVLLAMIGYKETLLNPKAKVDSKLYALIFDLIRSNDYERCETRYSSVRMEDFRRTASLPWMNMNVVEMQIFQEEFGSVLEQHAARSAQNRVTLPSAPPSYDSVVVIPPPGGPTREMDDGLPTYEQVLSDIVNRSES